MSPRGYVRSGGAWVSSAIVGKARYGGADVIYAPPVVGPAYESVALGNPASPFLQDGGQGYNMGMEFSLVAAKNAYGVQWRVPTSVATPPGNNLHAVSIWRASNTTRVAYKEFTPTPGVVQDILFDSQVALLSGVTYVAAVYTVSYSFTSGSPIGKTSPSGNVVAGAGRLSPYNGGSATAPYPLDPFNATYHVSPLIAK